MAIAVEQTVPLVTAVLDSFSLLTGTYSGQNY